jgi:hypothetical protein
MLAYDGSPNAALDTITRVSAIDTSPHGWATGDNLAGPVTSLLSDEAAIITGVRPSIDGGYRSR